jgi:hypothetical protein
VVRGFVVYGRNAPLSALWRRWLEIRYTATQCVGANKWQCIGRHSARAGFRLIRCQRYFGNPDFTVDRAHDILS